MSSTRTTTAAGQIRFRADPCAQESFIEHAQHTVTDTIEEVKESLTHLWDDIPAWQRDNCYIRRGYVKETNCYKKTFKALGFVHNETVNIYSHLIPALTTFVGGVAAYGLGTYLDVGLPIYPTTTWKDHGVFILFMFGIVSCLGMSATFHCIKCHSQQVARTGNQLDYLGIVSLVVSSMFGIIFYGYDHGDYERWLYWGLTFSLGTICACVSLMKKFHTSEWRPFRALMFVLFGLSGGFPVIHACFRFGYEGTVLRIQLPWILLEAAAYIGGAGIYAARVPEKWSPGTFDIIGSSHQIFHMCVVLGVILHWIALLGTYHAYHGWALSQSPIFFR
ncbi:hemolysin-III related-domain-containing protein [Yarrowia lipolytica]|jgi:adiponectin receptor|uniref:YALI0E17677p n=2 Tax=Yarrowia lipolytica TaxID=4952 RepID=Q6C5J0_YARLI|nr:YALI0E17677p [Yarrowia lipolytica CLIB122]AOW05558.1 hypothetical protein YALI1_E20963g [Yarrowia lipolytica]KAB8282741.1 hemolysin-III related-domain-containing protein [Yarrowia lipolytica]KAE8173771.1 hemolysin-III related-domain-containing protein [Yarrowia lipolytica]KAJ8057047.1 hemolysin-III related-domain-containing protein [Yarrowia lipolytica]QNP99038.1 ADIPOR-like receptor IZH2 [Yarrowia lipolytica]|eukprot:XP_504072.1 YALI0E17677p [Yarrowia lipolytica CLIB122]